MTQLEQLQQILATTTDPFLRDSAQREIDRLAAVGNAQIQVAAQTGQGDPELLAVLAGIRNLLVSQTGQATGTVNMADVRTVVNQELALRKIDINDLSPALLARLQSNRPVTLTINNMMGIPTTTKGLDPDMIRRPLTQLLLSDIMARNNVYLYGGAGTGKTFIAEYMATVMGWRKIVLNCNQFTSPLDILGGQTIDGYQQGKLSMAWSNVIVDENNKEEKVDGCVLILDELPKIDPNTAGILNDALAKVKDFKMDETTGQVIRPTIQDGRNKVWPLGNLFVVATGNVPLNTIDPDYEANFKQDLSLQDRFIGSTYRVFVDAENEFNKVMLGYRFIFIFLFKLRKAIVDARATSQAFVSLRIMINAKATYQAYRDVIDGVTKKKGAISNTIITNPKTLEDTMDNFFGLFKESTRATILSQVDYPEFKKIIKAKNKMPKIAPGAVNSFGLPLYDTPDEITEGQKLVDDYKASQKII